MRSRTASKSRWQLRSATFLLFCMPLFTGAGVGMAALALLSDGARMLDWVVITLIAACGIAASAACGRLYRRFQHGAA